MLFDSNYTMKTTQFFAIKSAFRKVEFFSSYQLIENPSLLDPMDIPEVSCFLQGVVNHGLTWSQYNPDIISDGTYAANPTGYQTLKIDIQTRCVKETFKRRFFRVYQK